MNKYSSKNAKYMYNIRHQIRKVADDHFLSYTHVIGDRLFAAIKEIEMLLRRDNVQVRGHPQLVALGFCPNLPFDAMLKRLKVGVHVLCILADNIENGRPTAEESEAVQRGKEVLEKLSETIIPLLYKSFPVLMFD